MEYPEVQPLEIERSSKNRRSIFLENNWVSIFVK